MANKQDRRIFQNRDEVISLTLLDENGDPFDLTGLATSDIQWGFAASAGAAAPIVAAKVIGTGIEVISAEDGTIEVTVAADDTAALDAGTYYHEATIETDDGTEQACYGVLEIAVTLLDPPA